MSHNHRRPPFRAEHMGSLLRPKALSDKRVEMDAKKAVEITEDPELRKIEDDAIDEIVKVQLDLGYHAVTDGEYRRHQFCEQPSCPPHPPPPPPSLPFLWTYADGYRRKGGRFGRRERASPLLAGQAN